MNAIFDSEKFERLNGMALGLYAAEICGQGSLPENFLDYFKANVTRWDGQHLEAALSLLGKVDSDAARHEIADFLLHHLDHIRLLVIRMLGQMPVDAYVRAKIGERLRSATDEAEVTGLRRLHRETRA